MILYNTLSKKKEKFIPLDKKNVKIYACGPTVYNYIHIGNARPLCVFDVLRRYLIYKGYNVTFVQNFTDIDDKIINRANNECVKFSEISERFIKEFKIDSNGLNVLPADIHPKATETIDEIINMVSDLVDKGYAYFANGDVYFNSLKFKKYGSLSGQPLDDLIAGARIETDARKKHPLDFVLWKSSKEGEPSWNSPWGAGRPGWHIECSAMIKKYLGETIDIHCGGQDLIFPHHENEIAQSESVTSKPLSRFWIHNGFINVDNRKMSKSLGNFSTVREISSKYGYLPIRFLMVSSHYRNPLNFSLEILSQCKNSIQRLSNFKCNLLSVKKFSSSSEDICPQLDLYRQKFESFMDDDLNFSGAISIIFDLVKNINVKIFGSTQYSPESIDKVIDLIDELLNIMGLKIDSNIDINPDVINLFEQRNHARQEKNWDLSDKIRDSLIQKGFSVRDTKQGSFLLVNDQNKNYL